MHLDLVYRWHPNFDPECERGAYLSFVLVSAIAAHTDTPRFQRTANAQQWNHIQLPLDNPHVMWNDVVLFVRMYSYNSISPGVFDPTPASSHTRTWACQRTCYAMIPLTLAYAASMATAATSTSYADAVTTGTEVFRFRSMLPLTQASKGFIEIDWNASCVWATAPQPFVSLRMPDALDVEREDPNDSTTWVGVTHGTVVTSDVPLLSTAPTLATCIARQRKSYTVHGIEWIERRQRTLRAICAPWTRSEQLRMDAPYPFTSVGLRDKYAPGIYLPIGPVPCMVNIIAVSRCSFREKFSVAYVGYLVEKVISMQPGLERLFPSSPTTAAAGAARHTLLPTPTVEWLELLHSVASLSAQLRPYRLDAIDMCNNNHNGQRPSPTPTYPDWFDIMESHQKQPSWSPNDLREAMSNPLVIAENVDTSTPGRRRHVFAVGDQVDHDMQGAHISNQGNDCESRTCDVLVFFQRIQSCFIDDPAHFQRFTTLLDDVADSWEVVPPKPDGTVEPSARHAWTMYTLEQKLRQPTTSRYIEYGLMLSAIANQYVFVYTIVASAIEYNSSIDVAAAHHASYLARTANTEVLLSSPTTGTQLSRSDHDRCWQDPLGFACHVVGIWFPRDRWRALRVRGVASAKSDPAFAVDPSAASLYETTESRSQPTGVCDPSDQTHAMQFVSDVAHQWQSSSSSSTLPGGKFRVPDDTLFDEAYDALHSTRHGFAHARLMSVRKPRSYTKEYMQYSMAVTACEYSSMRHKPSIGDVIFVDTVTRRCGLPFSQLMRPGIASPDFNMDALDGSGAGTTTTPTHSMFAAEPMTEPLTPQQRRDIQECLHLIPRTMTLPISGLVDATTTRPDMTTTPSSSSSSQSQTPVMCAWMTRINWLQSPPPRGSDASSTYGQLFMEWCARQRHAWRIVVSDEFTWLYDGCEAKEIRFYKV